MHQGKTGGLQEVSSSAGTAVAAGAGVALLTEWILEQPKKKPERREYQRRIPGTPIVLGAENLPEMERPRPAVGIWKDGCLSIHWILYEDYRKRRRMIYGRFF